MTTKIENMANLLNRLADLGFSYSEAKALRRIEMTLQRWSEQECGDGNDHCSWAIERDEITSKPYRVVYQHSGKSYRISIPDREAGALARLAKIMASHPALVAFHQGDPRGCALYILRQSDVGQERIDSIYTRGVAVCA